MKKILIVYQLRTREYDNALLLRAILEKRGYTVKIKNDADSICLFEKFDFIIWPCLYNDKQFDILSYRFNAYQTPAISMRYEQVFTTYDQNNGLMVPTGKAKHVPMMNWGLADYDYCKKNGVPERNLAITGFITLDYLRTELSSFWYSRNEIIDRYNLPPNKKLVLFTSSFALADNLEVAKTIDTYKENNDAIFITDLNTRSRKAILKWLEQLIIDDNNLLVIYRPHPAEKRKISLLNDLQEKYPDNFRIIFELNIKQWILIADIVTTWVSTSIAECYMAGKQCIVLRPEEYPPIWDIIIYKGARFITTYEDFKLEISNSLYTHSDTIDFPIARDLLRQYYDINDRPAFLRIFDEVEKHINDIQKSEFTKIKWITKKWFYLIFNGYITKLIIKLIYRFIHKQFHLTVKSLKLRKKYAIELWEDEAVNKIFYKKDENMKLNRLRIIVNDIMNSIEATDVIQ